MGKILKEIDYLKRYAFIMSRICICLLHAIVFLSLQYGFAQKDSSIRIKNTKTIRLTGSILTVISPDGRHIMHATLNNKKISVGVDGVDFEDIEMDKISKMVFSPDSKRTAYIGIKNRHHFLVIDGKFVREINGEPSYNPQIIGLITKEIFLAFTPDSKQVYYPDNDGWHVGEKVYKFQMAPTFSLDGNRIAFVNFSLFASTSPSNTVENFVYVDSVKHKVNGVVIGSEVLFSPDGKHFAFLIIRPEGIFVNMDGQETPTVGEINPKYYPQSKRKNGIIYLVSNWNLNMLFSPDSKRFAYWGNRDWQDRKETNVIVIDGKADPPFSVIQSPVFSFDSKHFAYLGHHVGFSKATHWAIIDGVKQSLTNNAYELFMSPDGKRLGYVYYKSIFATKFGVVVDSIFDQNDYLVSNYYVPVFSPTGKHAIYPGLNNNSLVIDGISRSIDGEAQPTQTGRIVLFDSDERFHYIVSKKIDKKTIEFTVVDEIIN